MHEMGIALQIIEIASSSIPESMEGTKVEFVNLRIGKLSAVVPESLTLCFEVASKDTPLNGAKLKIEEIDVVAKCRECDHQWTVAGPAFLCEKCDTGEIDIISGRELDISSIELEDKQEKGNHGS